MAPVFLDQLIPWERFGVSWLIPALVILFVGGLLWSVWSLLHAVVKA